MNRSAKSVFRLSLLFFIIAVVSACAPLERSDALSTQATNAATIDPTWSPHGNVYAGRQPTQQELKELSVAGIKTVISLRAPGELEWDQGAVSSELGIKYINLPIASATDITVDNAQRFMSLIEEHNSEPMLVHCASGNRVGALIATAENTLNNSDTQMSIAKGKEWGLTSLEPRVREVLGEQL